MRQEAMSTCAHLNKTFNSIIHQMTCIKCGLVMKNEKSVFKDYCKSCPHLNQIDDEREGNRVCTDCGLVMEPAVYTCSTSYFKNNCENIFSCNTEDSNGKKVTCLEIEKDELNTLCDKLHIYTVTKEEIMKTWKSIEKWYQNPQNQSRKYNKQGLIVLAIYQTLNKLNMSRPMSHLCQEAGIHPGTVWFWMKKYFSNEKKENYEVITNSSVMCEYFLKPLELTYKEIKKIKKKVLKNDELTFAPKTLITACAYMLLRNNNKNKLSIQKTAKLLGVSVMSVYRCVNALKK